jgi:hypothetical protein
MIISKFKRELNGDISEIKLNTGEKLQNVEYLTDLEEKTVTENGTYTPGTGKVGFSKVVVNVSGGSSEGTTKLYVWKNEGVGIDRYLMTATEELTDDTKVFISSSESGTPVLIGTLDADKVSFSSEGITYSDDLFTRSSSDDVDLF